MDRRSWIRNFGLHAQFQRCLQFRKGSSQTKLGSAPLQGVQDVTCITEDIRKLSGHKVPRPSAFGSAGNSFGIMDGGVDLYIRNMLSSPEVSMQQRCRAAIAEQFGGEQPVGTCILIPSPVTEVFDWLAYAPTMRVPEDVRATYNAYLAFRAMLNTIIRHNESGADPIRGLVTTSLCTATGLIPAKTMAAQMRLAYDSIFEAHAVEWPEVLAFHRKLRLLMTPGEYTDYADSQ